MTPRILGFNFTATAKLEPQPDGLLKLVPIITMQDMAQELVNYWRWCAEGKPPFGNCWNPDKRPTQYYHDNYHNHIEWHPDTEDYSFRIQTDDSPEGDTWLAGRFTYQSRDGITITEKREEFN